MFALHASSIRHSASPAAFRRRRFAVPWRAFSTFSSSAPASSTLRRIATVFAGLVVAASLAACSGGGDDTPEVPPGDTTVNEEPALVTGEGTPVGDAVVASIGSTGGMSTAGGVGVSVPDGAFTGAEALTLQPTTNPVEDGAAALKISSTVA